MFKRYIKILFLILFCNTCVILSDEFLEGPYGTNYFDIAAPFSVPDLNAAFQGDANIAATVSSAGTYLISYLSDGTNAYLTNSAVFA